MFQRRSRRSVTILGSSQGHLCMGIRAYKFCFPRDVLTDKFVSLLPCLKYFVMKSDIFALRQPKMLPSVSQQCLNFSPRATQPALLDNTNMPAAPEISFNNLAPAHCAYINIFSIFHRKCFGDKQHGLRECFESDMLEFAEILLPMRQDIVLMSAPSLLGRTTWPRQFLSTRATCPAFTMRNRMRVLQIQKDCQGSECSANA